LGATAQGWASIVYLSAIPTAEIRVKSLLDESIHIASAFQIAGFARVICPLWSTDDDVCVTDDVCARLAELFYNSTATRKSTADLDWGVARALREAGLQLREEYASSPDFWALYVHLGPNSSITGGYGRQLRITANIISFLAFLFLIKATG
jgi:CHAT domain-containing protein